MTTYNATVTVTLDREPSEIDARRIGKQAAGDELVMVSVHGPRLSVSAATNGQSLDLGLGPHNMPLSALTRTWQNLMAAAAELGYVAEQVEALEVLSQAEADRRIESAGVPPLVSTAQFAEMCGVTTQRIYELETDRKKAADAGQPHDMPTPIVRGWYVKAAAERYAATRKRKPGPAPKAS